MYTGSLYFAIEETDRIGLDRGIVHIGNLSVDADTPALFRKLAAVLNEAADQKEAALAAEVAKKQKEGAACVTHSK